MSLPNRPIADLRREIDEIDTALHDLVMRRAEVAAQIGAAKNGGASPDKALQDKALQDKGGDGGRSDGAAVADARATDGGSFIRPGREAAILRRLVARHRGPLPAAVVVQLWRELMSALLRLQAPIAVAVYVPEQLPGFWDLARDHFGSHTPATAHETPSQVLSMLFDGLANVAVLPLPQQDDRDPWWRHLLRRDGPRVIARLPFGDGGTQRGPAVQALAVGRVAAEETGRDRTLFVLETSAEISRSALATSLKAAQLEVTLLHGWQDDQINPTTWLHLVEVEGFVHVDDPRLLKLAKRRSEILRHMWPLGGYAVPFTRAELGGPDKA